MSDKAVLAKYLAKRIFDVGAEFDERPKRIEFKFPYGSRERAAGGLIESALESVIRQELDSFEVTTGAAIEFNDPVAWMTPSGEIVSHQTMQRARQEGGAMLSSLANFTIPLYRRKG